MLALSIQIDERSIAQVKAALGGMEREAPKVLAGAINETLREARTSLSRKVREVLALSKKSTDSRIHLELASWQRLSGEVRLSHEKRPGLMSFGARQTKRGVSYKLTVAGGRRTIAHAFIRAKRGQSHENVFIRKTVGGKMVGRMPLVRLQGLSPWGAIVYRAGVLEQWHFDSQQAFEKNLAQRVNAWLKGFITNSPRRAAA